MAKLSKVAKGFALFVLLLGVFTAGYSFGNNKAVVFDGFLPKIIDRSAAGYNLDLFYEVNQLVRQNFFGEIDKKRVVEYMVRGFVAGLGDPHSTYFDAKEAEEFNTELSGELNGIGIEIGLKDEKIVVIAPLSGTPAEAAGLKAGDRILEIDGKSTLTMTVTEAASAIRGKVGTKVKLKIGRQNEIKTFEITRAVIKVPVIKSEIKEKGIGYIKIAFFSTDLKSELGKAIDEFNSKDVRVIILDLRNNPGGLLEEATALLDEIIEEGSLVVQEDKDGKKTKFSAEPGGRLVGKKFVVLINEGSASASEIVAGALIELANAVSVGQKSFGKGSIQQPYNLSNGGLLKLTIAHWLTPKEKAIDGIGITPGIIVEDADKQLERAVEEAKIIL